MKLRVVALSVMLGMGCFGISAHLQAQSQSKKPAPRRIMRIRLTGPAAHKLIKSEVPPIYPEDASKKKIQGTVRLHIIIGVNGLVNEINVVSGKSQLQSAAVDAVRKWQYEVSSYQGHPVEVETVVDIVFKLG